MRVMLLSVLVVTLLLGLAGTALAATPQDVYNDYVKDGHLKGPYTIAELEAYSTDSTVHQYGNSAVLAELDAFVQKILGIWKANTSLTWDEVIKLATGASSGKPKDRKSFPFTGFELMLASMGGLALIGGGVVIRRTAK